MAKTLIVAATEAEIEGLRSTLADIAECEFLVTGIGMVNTTFTLTKYLNGIEPPKKIINVGIAGAFNPEIEIGQAVQVVKDRFSELGAEDSGSFLKADEMGLMKKQDVEFESSNKFSELIPVSGITVNTIHGNERSISQARQLYNPDVESMEGAAVAFVAEQFGCDWIQIRCISNYVEPRNKDNWNIPLALENLNTTVTQLIKNSF
ncbi:MAG: futalosine hydrolase [Bacteroidia bacterium]|jgi:futalosine hydrolase